MPTSNGQKVSIALEEMQIPYTAQMVNIKKGEQFSPEFLSVSSNNRIPAIIDFDSFGKKPTKIFESGAILIYLADKLKDNNHAHTYTRLLAKLEKHELIQ